MSSRIHLGGTHRIEVRKKLFVIYFLYLYMSLFIYKLFILRIFFVYLFFVNVKREERDKDDEFFLR